MVARWTLLLGLVCTAVLPGCSSDDEVRPSPLPPGYLTRLREQRATQRTTGGRIVDQTLAVVDGQVLTRREVLRRLRLSEAEARSGDVEEEIKTERKEWARQRLVLAAARRARLSIPPSTVDDITEEQLRKEMATHAKETGQELDRDAYLRGRNLSWDEYREQIKGLVLTEAYFRKVTRGLAGARPEVDWDVSPAEVRRIYHDNRAAFDEPAGVRMALLRFPIERFERDGRDLLEAEALATRTAEAAKRDLEAGRSVREVMRRHGVREGDAQVMKDEEWLQRPPVQPDRPEGEDVAFLFAPERRPGDAMLLPLGDGPHVIVVLARREARRRTLEEVYGQIVQIVQSGKQGRATAQLTIEQITRGGSVVWPPELADELLAEAREMMSEIAEHPVLGKARLK